MSLGGLLLASACALFAARPEPVPVKNEVKFTGVYFAPDEVSEKASATKMPPPSYPHEWSRQGLHGKAVVAFIINQKGRPEQVQAVSATDAAFGWEAVEAVKKWRFKPARKDGAPVSVLVRQLIEFHLEGKP